MNTQELIASAKAFGIVVGPTGNYGLYRVSWTTEGGHGTTAIPERMIESTLNRIAKDRARNKQTDIEDRSYKDMTWEKYLIANGYFEIDESQEETE